MVSVSQPMIYASCGVCGIEASHEKVMKNWDVDLQRKTVVKCPMCSARDSGAMEVA